MCLRWKKQQVKNTAAQHIDLSELKTEYHMGCFHLKEALCVFVALGTWQLAIPVALAQ